MALQGRALDHPEWSTNSPEMIKEHESITKGLIRMRFPPEPNGYLHIGHAKSINMNFELAFEKLNTPVEKRMTILRYDDTNPEMEKDEYIHSISNDVKFLGFTPAQITYSSEYFPQMHTYAIQLIKQGDAYVCHQNKDQMEYCKSILKERLQPHDTTTTAAKPIPNPDPAESPYRNRSVSENLDEFEKMRRGEYAEKKACLRLKFDLNSNNVNLWDPVGYRIKFSPHPHVGTEWCIYPTYEFAHCIEDSIEHIDYSICTLEFETRRESYYLLLHKLGLYKPNVYEFARLQLTSTVLSKRKVKYLVEAGHVTGWDDPRLATLSGLRRLGMTKEIINGFCKEIGVTRNESTVQIQLLHSFARTVLGDSAPRCMGVLDPIKVTLLNYPTDKVEYRTVPNFPQKASQEGHETHTIPFSRILYIDSSDFRQEDSSDYFGLAPDKEVGLKYSYHIKCTKVYCNEKGTVIALDALVDLEKKNKPKGHISWVSYPPEMVSLPTVEVRCYSSLLLSSEEEEDTLVDWKTLVNPNSKVVYSTALVDYSVLQTTYDNDVGKCYQFERLGYFVIDSDSTRDKLVFNRTLPLRDTNNTSLSEKSAAGPSRKEEQQKAMEDKIARMKIPAKEMFKNNSLYSTLNTEGVPTHDAAGEPLSKSLLKKLLKEFSKQKKLHEKYLKDQQ